MFRWLKKLSAPRKRPRERTWLRFELCVEGKEKEELYALLDRTALDPAGAGPYRDRSSRSTWIRAERF